MTVIVQDGNAITADKAIVADWQFSAFDEIVVELRQGDSVVARSENHGVGMVDIIPELKAWADKRGVEISDNILPASFWTDNDAATVKKAQAELKKFFGDNPRRRAADGTLPDLDKQEESEQKAAAKKPAKAKD